MAVGPLQYAAKLDRLRYEITSPQATEDLLKHLGLGAKEDVKQGVVPDVGSDRQLSNWPKRTGKKTPLGGRYNILTPTTMSVTPDRYSAGPFAMLEDGRRPRRVGQFTSKGRRRSKSGAVSTRLRVVTRPVGPMAAKETWSDAERVIVRNYPLRLDRWKNGRLARWSRS